MRFRYILIILLISAALIPAAGLGLWTRHHLEKTQFADVTDRHLLLAKNLEQAMSRYYRDIISGFDLLAGGNTSMIPSAGHNRLAVNLGIRHICSMRVSDRALIAASGFEAPHCADYTDEARFKTLMSYAKNDQTIITPVMKTPEGFNRMLVLRLKNGHLCIGSLETNYFITLGKSIKFGVKGHAAIIDQEGNLLAHPLDTWTAEAKNISKLSVVKRMMAGETGIEQFFSPALKGDMIAGFTHTQGAGWGVMIPQPVQELYDQAAMAQRPITFIVIASLIIALILSLFLANRVAFPLERITQTARLTRKTKTLHEVVVEDRSFMPLEQHEIIEAYNGMVHAIRGNHMAIRNMAYTDSLTGLLNRAAFNTLAKRSFDNAVESGQKSALLYFDLDGFKAINDTHGHACGDYVLKQIASRVERLVQSRFGNMSSNNVVDQLENDTEKFTKALVARIGGDEFTLLLPDLADQADMKAFAAELAATISRPILYEDAKIHAASSVGAAAFPSDADDLDHVMRRADVALYHAKGRGKGGCCIYDPENGVRSLAEIREELSLAITSGQLELHYQPKVLAKSGNVESVEALVRWRHPERGLVPPVEFIPHIEQSQVVVQLGEWVINQAMSDIKLWRSEGRALNVAINIAARHFLEPDFADRMKQLVSSAGINPNSVELEITEEAATGPLESGRDVIGSLKHTGFRVALDDYGRGYSNLNRLAELNVDTIKIDRSLIMGVIDNERTRHIVTATTRMAESLQCRVVAEGIEDASQAAMLRRLGCHELQGYYFAKPMQQHELMSWLTKRSSPSVIDLQQRLAAKA